MGLFIWHSFLGRERGQKIKAVEEKHLFSSTAFFMYA
jgi:hypothetical protein